MNLIFRIRFPFGRSRRELDCNNENIIHGENRYRTPLYSFILIGLRKKKSRQGQERP